MVIISEVEPAGWYNHRRSRGIYLREGSLEPSRTTNLGAEYGLCQGGARTIVMAEKTEGTYLYPMANAWKEDRVLNPGGS